MWPRQESSLMPGVPAGWVASSAWGGRRASWAGTVTVSGGGFLTSGLEGSATNLKVWGWRLTSQIWGPEVFTRKRQLSLSCAVLSS